MKNIIFSKRILWPLALFVLFNTNCSKNKGDNKPAENVYVYKILINNKVIEDNAYGININPVIKVQFSQPINLSSLSNGIILQDANGNSAPVTYSLLNNDSIVQVQPAALNYLSKYTLSLKITIASKAGGKLYTPQANVFVTSIDSSRKFPAITDVELLTKVQQQTFKYFWDFGHPVSGLARERSNGDNEVVTSGGSGFGIMAIPVGISRGFITRPEGLARVQKIVAFLKASTTPKFHGAFSHWMNGTTGAVVPFGTNDNGADLVETSYLMMGLLTARQYFNGTDAAEAALRADINALYNAVEWDWFRQGGKNILYWNWSADKGWIVNVPVQGWNECLITYVMAASSPTHTIDKPVYDSGYARNGAMKNGNNYYGYTLPLGENLGGPLFFEHYSFLGINPNNLSDASANYTIQTKNHTLINYNYCKINPKNYYGYSDSVWGLTASDIKNGYTASSPTNDQGFIAPTAAISSMPYTYNESMAALKFFYYTLGDKLWGTYGFKDAFTLDIVKNSDAWFADSYLAIDQGPIIVMIENYRTGLLWNLFMSCPEVKNGLQKLGFTGY